MVGQVITFIDLAGHEKYLKTTVFGLTGHAPDYVMLMIGSNAGIIGMTKGIVSLSIPPTFTQHLSTPNPNHSFLLLVYAPSLL